MPSVSFFGSELKNSASNLIGDVTYHVRGCTNLNSFISFKLYFSIFYSKTALDKTDPYKTLH